MIINTTYDFSFPCKTISNFYDNFYKIHIYDEIKSVVYRSETKTFNETIYNYFLLFQTIYSLSINSNWNDYKSLYKRITSNTFSCYYESTINEINKNLYRGIYVFSILKHNNLVEAFVVYLFIQNQLNLSLGHTVLIPSNLIEQCRAINNADIGENFLKCWFLLNLKKEIDDVKKEIISLYKEDKTKILGNTNIEEIYLFGSILKNNYHSNSDIDLVIKFKNNISIEEAYKTKTWISAYNKTNFNKDTDIQEFYSFIESHNINECLKLI